MVNNTTVSIHACDVIKSPLPSRCLAIFVTLNCWVAKKLLPKSDFVDDDLVSEEFTIFRIQFSSLLKERGAGVVRSTGCCFR